MKLCIDCAHFQHHFARESDRSFFRDACFVFRGQPHPVSGKAMDWVDASAMRMGPCGIEGKMFEPINIARADHDRSSSHDYPSAQLSAEG